MLADSDSGSRTMTSEVIILRLERCDSGAGGSNSESGDGDNSGRRGVVSGSDSRGVMTAEVVIVMGGGYSRVGGSNSERGDHGGMIMAIVVTEGVLVVVDV